MQENPGVYNEARNRIREKKDEDRLVAEVVQEHFERSKEKLTKKKGLDIFELKRKIETGQSLESLKSDISMALKEGDITIETYNQAISDIEKSNYNNGLPAIDKDLIPFSQNKLAIWLESQPLGNSIRADIVGFLYGFFVQGSAILVIIAWRLLLDLLRLPVDVYQEFKKEF